MDLLPYNYMFCDMKADYTELYLRKLLRKEPSSDYFWCRPRVLALQMTAGYVTMASRLHYIGIIMFISATIFEFSV